MSDTLSKLAKRQSLAKFIGKHPKPESFVTPLGNYVTDDSDECGWFRRLPCKAQVFASVELANYFVGFIAAMCRKKRNDYLVVPKCKVCGKVHVRG